MSWMFLALLVVAWVAVFVPTALRAWRRTPLPSAEGFRRTQAHRRRLFVALLCAVVLSAGAALLRGGALWEVHLALDACMGIYVALLLDAKKRRNQSSSTVTQISSRRGTPPQGRVLEQAVGHFGGRRS